VLVFFKKMPLPFFLFVILVMSACVTTKRPLEQPVALEKKAPTESPKPNDSKGPSKDPSKDPRLDLVIQQFQRGIRLLAQDKVQKAKTLFETLRNDYPGVSVFHSNLGVVYKRLGRFEDAMHAYRQAISIAAQSPGGDYAEAYYNLAIVLREQGLFKEAETAYLRALSIDPDFQDAHFNLAVLYDLYLNEPERGIHHYQRHLALKKGADEEISIWIAALEKRLKIEKGQP